MVARRLPQSGSVYRRSDGRWVAAVMVDGKRRQRYARSEAEAWQHLVTMTGEALPWASPGKTTLAGWWEQWLARRGLELRPTTIYFYRRWLRRFFRDEPALASTPLTEVTRGALALAFSRQAEKRGRRVLATTFVVLRKCFADAVRDTLLVSNPMAGLAAPVWERRVRLWERWDTDDTTTLLVAAAAARSRFAPMLVLLLTTGMRYGEVVALDWTNVDLDRGRLHVSANMVMTTDRRWHRTPPKTAAGRRTISLPAAGLAALRRAGPRSSGPVFTTSKGHPPYRELPIKVLRRLLARHGLPQMTLHGLRHLHAMLVLRATKDAHAVQRRLGHSHVGTTMRVYLWALTKDGEVADALDELLKRPEPPR